MSTTATRLVLGFLAGFLSHLIFQGGFGSLLFAANVLPALPFSLMPVAPFGVPQTLNLGLWAGLWGVGYALLEPRLTALFGRWLGGLVYGLAPLAGYWFVVLPLKGLGVGGGFHLGMVPIEVGFHAVFGIGTAIIYRSGLVLTGLRVGASSEENVNVEGEHSEHHR
ncbi:MAG TPA: hypothetical protein VED46_10400 [Alphaproteobacteria bacterium]|nr:hypothetical protein [Alphaproteobacteria bacterium]